MKKSLVALATLAATGAMAQVTIDGYVDRAYTITNNTDNTKDSKLIGSQAGTTTIGIKVRESLSSDLSAGISLNTDFADQGGLSQDNATTSVQSAGFANGQTFVDLTSKSMGTLRLGAPNNFTLTNVTGVASPGFSTGIGSAYGSSFTIANGLGTGVVGSVGIVNQTAISNTSNTGARAIRIANTVQYSSPVMNGFSVHLGSTAKNSNGGTGTDTVGVTEYALRYTNGPIDAMYTNIKYTVGNSPANGSITANTDNTQDMLGASYAINPALKLHAGFGNTKSSSDVFKGKSQQFGVSYTIGAVNLMAQMAKFDDTSSTDIDRKMTGVGVNYNLSKTSRVYLRMDDINYASNVTAVNAVKRTAIGVSKSF